MALGVTLTQTPIGHVPVAMHGSGGSAPASLGAPPLPDEPPMLPPVADDPPALERPATPPNPALTPPTPPMLWPASLPSEPPCLPPLHPGARKLTTRIATSPKASVESFRMCFLGRREDTADAV